MESAQVLLEIENVVIKSIVEEKETVFASGTMRVVSAMMNRKEQLFALLEPNFSYLIEGAKVLQLNDNLFVITRAEGGQYGIFLPANVSKDSLEVFETLIRDHGELNSQKVSFETVEAQSPANAKAMQPVARAVVPVAAPVQPSVSSSSVDVPPSAVARGIDAGGRMVASAIVQGGAIAGSFLKKSVLFPQLPYKNIVYHLMKCTEEHH